jgi:hypothetical protein
MAIVVFSNIAITNLGGDNIVNGTEAGAGGFVINGTGTAPGSGPANGSPFAVTLTFTGGVTQNFSAITSNLGGSGGTKTFNWTIAVTGLSPLAQGADTVVVTFPGPVASLPFSFTYDTVAPSAPTITTVTDDVIPGIGTLPNGASTNDTNLTLNVSLTGLGAVAGDTVHLYNGIDTTNPLGTYTLLSTDISNGFANVSTGTLATTGSFALTARLIDQAGNTGAASSTFNVVEDPSAVCFARGTYLLTATGEVLVEALQPGALMVQNDGSEAPVKWIGRRRIDLTAHPRPATVAPIRIQRDAFADNMPYSDLLVSPDHAIFVDGKLICARQLINGSTIRQEMTWTSVEYFHVELESHAILLAEGLPAESYLDTGNQGFFANAGAPLVLHPDLTDETGYPTREAASCAPFVSDEGNVRPVWQRLSDRAAALGQFAPKRETATDADLHIVAKGRTVRPLYGENGRYIFALPKGATDVRVVSRASSPADARPWLEDRRCLGVYVEQIVLRDASDVQTIAVDDPHLSQGWWAVEQDATGLRRWTNGNAVLPLPPSQGPAMLEIRTNPDGIIYVTDVEPDRRAA